jgi:hypothetical protein
MTPHERNRLRSERWRRAHGIGPRRPAQRPWVAEVIGGITCYGRQGPWIDAAIALDDRLERAPPFSHSETPWRHCRQKNAESGRSQSSSHHHCASDGINGGWIIDEITARIAELEAGALPRSEGELIALRELLARFQRRWLH